MAEYIERIKALAIVDLHHGARQAYHKIRNLPAADVELVKRGKWLPQILLGQRVWDCSECKTLGSPHWKRCPICEAKMEVAGDG